MLQTAFGQVQILKGFCNANMEYLRAFVETLIISLLAIQFINGNFEIYKVKRLSQWYTLEMFKVSLLRYIFHASSREIYPTFNVE